MTDAEREIIHLKEEVVPQLAMLCYSLGRLAEWDDDEPVDSFQLEADAMMWWHRIEGKSRELDTD